MALKTKADWRVWAKETRQTLSIGPMSDAIVAHLAHWPVFEAAHTVLAFSALPGEVDLSELRAQFPQKAWYLPRVMPGDTLAFYATPPETPLQRSPWGILEPPEDAAPLHPDVHVDLILLPALAVDTQGVRLGYGKGFYDRFLALGQTTGPWVCPVPSPLVVPRLPVDPWDKPVDWIVTENGLHATGA